ncbi:MAG: ABC transporter permease [Oligoflexus sp.]
MDKVLLITKRELSSYFTTWTGYIVVFAALLINGLLFNAFAIGDSPKFSSDVLRDFFFYSSGIAMVAAIFLAMRLLAEEKQTGTIILFYTSPITERQLVYGKFLSVVVVFLILQALSLHLPSLIFIEGKVSIGHMAAGYLGVILIGSAVLAIALFGSVVASNQMIAAVIGASITVVLLLLWIVANRVDEPFSSLFSYISLHNFRFRPFSGGIVHIKDLIYYFSLILFFLESSVRALETRRLQG